MSRTIRFRRDARREYEDAVDWYDTQQPGLGTQFYDAVESVLADLLTQPFLYAVVHKDVREAPVPGFKYYTVLYQIRRTHVQIISVFHQSRDPSAWQSRV